MQIFKWMPLKAEDQNLQTEKLVSNSESNDASGDFKIMSDVLNESSSNSISDGNCNGNGNGNGNGNKPTSSHSPLVNDESTKETNINNSANITTPKRDEPEPSNSPPPKRIKTSSIAIDEPEPTTISTSTIKVDTPQPMPIDEEPPQYNELRQVGMSTPLIEVPCQTAQNSPPQPSLHLSAQLHQTSTSLHTLEQHSTFVTECDREVLSRESLVPEQKQIGESQTMPPNDVTSMETDSCEDQKSNELPETMEMEDFSSIARMVTEQIVTKVVSGTHDATTY